MAVSTDDCEKSALIELKEKFFSENEKGIDFVPTLHINIGGKILRVAKKVLNEYSCQFWFFGVLSGRYDYFLPKDKFGRIFFDFDARWIEPIFSTGSTT